MEGRKEKYQIQLVFIGESTVGKTTIKDRLLKREFKYDTTPTLQPPYCEQLKFQNPHLPNAEIIINLWDTAGQEKYRANCTNCIKRADILVFVRDHLNCNFGDKNDETNWIGFVNKYKDLDAENLYIIFVLNKTDLISNEEEKKRIKEELLNLAQSFEAKNDVLGISSIYDEEISNFRTKLENISYQIIKDSLKSLNSESVICLYGPSEVGKTCLIYALMGNEFEESKTILTTHSEKHKFIFQDLKLHYNVKIMYCDIPGQDKLLGQNLKIINKADIILFVNDNDKLIINFNKLTADSLKNKKCIFCINKSDLFINEKQKIINNYKQINNKEKKFSEKFNEGNNFFLISIKENENIDELKDKLMNLSTEIVDEKNNKNKEKQQRSSVERKAEGNIIINEEDLPLIEQEKKNCWKKFCDSITNIFRCKY